MAAVCGVRKDAGDDADITDGMLICARVRLTDRNFFAGEERTSFSQEEKDGIFITGGDGRRPGDEAGIGSAGGSGSGQYRPAAHDIRRGEEDL